MRQRRWSDYEGFKSNAPVKLRALSENEASRQLQPVVMLRSM